MATLNDAPIIIADSSALVALSLANDALHEAAVAASQALVAAPSRIIVPSDIFTEAVNILGLLGGHQVAVRFAREVLAPPPNTFELYETPPGIREAALERYAHQPRRVSFTDCIVMAFADEFRTKRIFGWDEAFEKNGYRCPPTNLEERAA